MVTISLKKLAAWTAAVLVVAVVAFALGSRSSQGPVEDQGPSQQYQHQEPVGCQYARDSVAAGEMTQEYYNAHWLPMGCDY